MIITYPEQDFLQGCELERQDLLEMAAAMKKEHGHVAITLSQFFATEHARLGDQGWALAWSHVCDLLAGQTIEIDSHSLH